MMVPVGRLVVLRTTEKQDLIDAIALITWPGLIAPVVRTAGRRVHHDVCFVALDLFSERAARHPRDGAFVPPDSEPERRPREAVRLDWIRAERVGVRELHVRDGTRGPPDGALEADGRVSHRWMRAGAVFRAAFFPLASAAAESDSAENQNVRDHVAGRIAVPASRSACRRFCCR